MLANDAVTKMREVIREVINAHGTNQDELEFINVMAMMHHTSKSDVYKLRYMLEFAERIIGKLQS